MRRKHNMTDDELKIWLSNKANKNNDTECWEWGGSKNSDGYGLIRYHSKGWKVHRLSYKLFNGDIPKDLKVLHECDNPKCYNPKHLSIGTQLDNVTDMINKKRKHVMKGEKNPRAIITDEDVQMIRKHLLNNERGTDIAKKLNCSYNTVMNIKYNRAWKHVSKD